MEAVVWYASWQMECCGDPFAVGDHVTWTVEERDDDEWFVAALGSDLGARITHAEEHHAGDGDALIEMSGRVLSITCAWGVWGRLRQDDQLLVPLEGSARVVEVSEVDGGERQVVPGLTFNGWVVQLALEA